MKTYRIVVRDVYEVEANSPREAETKLDTLDKGTMLVEFTQSKPKLINTEPVCCPLEMAFEN